MSTPDLSDSERFDRYAAIDIETDGLDGAEDALVAIGVGFQSPDTDRDVTVHTLADARGDEATLIEMALEWLHRREPDGFVTYNGAEFDLPFLDAKLATLDADLDLDIVGQHVDLFAERKRLASLANEKWPSLEESLAHYHLVPAKTLWYGEVLTNTRFAEELAPKYLDALDTMEFVVVHALDDVICEYTSADIEATMSLYEADLGEHAIDGQ